MYESTVELAENKLLLLYIIKNIKFPISNSQLTDIILENNFINYFLLQQYITELNSSNFIKYEEIDNKKVLSITERGDKVLCFFKDRISPSKISSIDTYIAAKIEHLKKELTLFANYTIEDTNMYMVNLKATENGTTLIDLTINVATNKQAIDLCQKWRDNSSEIYNKIIQLLINS